MLTRAPIRLARVHTRVIALKVLTLRLAIAQHAWHAECLQACRSSSDPGIYTSWPAPAQELALNGKIGKLARTLQVHFTWNNEQESWGKASALS